MVNTRVFLQTFGWP